VRGVNAFIEVSRDNPPVEFKLTGIDPEPWAPDVPIMRMAGLPMTGNALNELSLARNVGRLGLAEANRLDDPDPFHRLQVPDGLDVASIPPEVLEILYTGYQPVPRIPLVGEYAAWEVDGDAPPPGSNNWVVNGEMTVTGKPLLANDPHRFLSNPSLRYLVHLSGPGWNVIGAGEPALPGVAIGHNEHIAWGLTIVGIDQQDIFVEEVNPDNGNEVRWRGGWEALQIEVDTIHVKGEAPRVVELKFSRHGPIVYEDSVHHRAYAFKSILAEPGTAGYLGSLRVDQATNWEEYLDAMDHWLMPSENMIYADTAGNIGWQAAGLTPIRCCGWVGRLPVPGTGEYEWRGFRPMRELPREYNPGRGYITTANHNIMPPGYDPPLGYDWSSPRRYLRLDDVLSDSGGFSVEMFEALQQDVYSRAAHDAVLVLQGWEAVDPPVERARQLLLAWDGWLRADGSSAALFRAWRDLVDDQALDGGVPTPTRRQLAEEALGTAINQLEAEQGADWNSWRYDRLRHTEFPHWVTEAYDIPPVPRPGDYTTVNLTGQSGASFREIIDLSDWDNSVATNVPGQSGQPGGPHYDDLVALWATGEYFPLLFSREAVVENTANLLTLRPAN
jgi:penicillin amidase